jgi:hypothetical protein
MKISELLSEQKCCPDVIQEDQIQEDLMITEAEYQGKTVELNKPFRTSGGPRKFSVYVKNDATGKVIKVNFGDPNSTIKNDDPVAAKSFQARHKCSEKTDKTTAGWWSCNVAKYHKLLNLSSSRPW